MKRTLIVTLSTLALVGSIAGASHAAVGTDGDKWKSTPTAVSTVDADTPDGRRLR